MTPSRRVISDIGGSLTKSFYHIKMDVDNYDDRTANAAALGALDRPSNRSGQRAAWQPGPPDHQDPPSAASGPCQCAGPYAGPYADTMSRPCVSVVMNTIVRGLLMAAQYTKCGLPTRGGWIALVN